MRDDASYTHIIVTQIMVLNLDRPGIHMAVSQMAVSVLLGRNSERRYILHIESGISAYGCVKSDVRRTRSGDSKSNQSTKPDALEEPDYRNIEKIELKHNHVKHSKPFHMQISSPGVYFTAFLIGRSILAPDGSDPLFL